MRRFEKLFLYLEKIRAEEKLCSAYYPKKTRFAQHYIFYHDEELLSKVKPQKDLENIIYVNLNKLPIPEGLRISGLTEEQNRAVFSEYLGILQIKPKADMVGIFTYSVPLKFCQDYVDRVGYESIFLPDIKFDYLENKQFNENKIYGVEFSSYYWGGSAVADIIKDIDNSCFHIDAADEGRFGPFKGSLIVKKDVFFDFQKWFLGATEYLIRKYGWECNIPSGSFNNSPKHYVDEKHTQFDGEFRRKIGHIQERLVAYYFGRKFSEKDRVKLGNFLAKPSLNLIVQYFKVHNEDRQKEIDLCLKNNCENPYIKKIFLLTEEKIEADILNHKKINQVVIGRRLKYSDAFKFANENCSEEIFILSNADIYFDESLKKIGQYEFDKLFLALSRHNHFKDGKDQLIIGNFQYNTDNVQRFYEPRGGRIEWGSQDAWVFKTPVSEDLVKEADFELGRINCDGHLLWLLKAVGYKVLNPCFSIIIRHLHDVFFGISRQNIDQHKEEKIKGSSYSLNPDGSCPPAEITWIPGDDSRGKMKMYVFYTPSHEYFLENFFLPSIKDDYFLVLERHNQDCPTGIYENDGWNDTMKRKVELIIRAIKENPGKTFIHSDVDVQFFGRTKDLILKSISDKDIVFQRDRTENKEKGFGGVYCAGFFACRGNERTLALFEDILTRMQDKNNTDNDETLLNDMLEHDNKHNVSFDYLPDIFWTPGIKYGDAGVMGKNVYAWEPGKELDVPSEIVMHHANWTKGVENKKMQLEYVKEKIFKARHIGQQY